MHGSFQLAETDLQILVNINFTVNSNVQSIYYIHPYKYKDEFMYFVKYV